MVYSLTGKFHCFCIAFVYHITINHSLIQPNLVTHSKICSSIYIVVCMYIAAYYYVSMYILDINYMLTVYVNFIITQITYCIHKKFRMGKVS